MNSSTPSTDNFARDILEGLRRPAGERKHLPPKYFYDSVGSRLFDKICQLPEYYPTRTEQKILQDNAKEIARSIGPKADLVEFGAGSLNKIRPILDGFSTRAFPSRYIPIDISGDHLLSALGALRTEYPQLTVEPVVGDYMSMHRLPGQVYHPVGFFPGSTIGNLEISEARQFLSHSADLLRGGGLLIGVDLVKTPAVLHAAYNDSEGVTAQFNLNILRRINRELDGTFNLDNFAHYAFYNVGLQRVEMHLVSQSHQTVTALGHKLYFDEGESIHTENSQKFTVSGFQELASEAGYLPKRVWVDEQRHFSVHWLESPQ